MKRDYFSTGPGVRVTRVAGRQIVAARVGSGESFAHPWRPSLQGNGIILERGLVNFNEPFVRVAGKDVPMSGDPKTGEVPVLAFAKGGPALAQASARGWVALEATLSEGWEILPKTLRLVQVAVLGGDGSDDGQMLEAGGAVSLPERKVRYPLVRLVARLAGVEAFPVAMFNYRHRSVETGATARHFFDPV